MRLTPGALLVAASTLIGSAAVGAENCALDTLTTNLGERNEYTDAKNLTQLAKGGTHHSFFSGHAGARWLRFRLMVRPDSKDSRWSLTIRNSLAQVLESYGTGSTKLGSDGFLWTGRLPADKSIMFDTWPDVPEARIEVREYIAMVEPPGENALYSLATPGNETWQDVETGGRDWMRPADNVALVMPSWSGENRGCTGFAVAPDVLMTNWHCGWVPGLDDAQAWNNSICRDTVIDFSFDNDQRSSEYRCVTRLAQSKALDYALLKIAPIDIPRHLSGVTLATSRRNTADLTMLHHPSAKRKKLSKNCKILDVKKAGWVDGAVDSRFTHLCDSAPGSSGAPVFDIDGKTVIGLHHRGVERDAANNCVENETPRRNKAIWMQDIIADIETKSSQIENKLGRKLDLIKVD